MTLNELVAHNHPVTNGNGVYTWDASSGASTVSVLIEPTTNNTKPVNISVGNRGGGQAMDITNPYLAQNILVRALSGPYAYGANFALRSIGGEAAHMLTLQELPVHQFGTQNGDRFIVLSDSGTEVLLGGENGYRVTFEWATRTLGGGKPHNNMPPYFAQNIIVRAL